MYKASSPGRPWQDRVLRAGVLLAAVLCSVLGGCASITNPVANGVPVRRMPPELLGEPKAGARPLPLTLLRQKPPQPYRLGPDDVLSIWVENVLGEKTQLPPTNFPEARNLPPSTGFPITIRSDGTIQLPY